LGVGAFGEIYSGFNVKTGEEVAFKLERHGSKMPVLAYEATIIKKLGGAKGFPRMYW
jgi:casein kinase 1